MNKPEMLRKDKIQRGSHLRERRWKERSAQIIQRKRLRQRMEQLGEGCANSANRSRNGRRALRHCSERVTGERDLEQLGQSTPFFSPAGSKLWSW